MLQPPTSLIRGVSPSGPIIFAAAACVLLGGATPSTGHDRERRIDQYVQRSWNIEDGLPQNSVLSITQTKEGFLWLGTQEGLGRFDGVEFDVHDRSVHGWLRDQFITALAPSAGGGVWIGTRDGLFRWENEQVVSITAADGLAESYIRALLPAADGILWIGTYGGGLARFSSEGIRVFGLVDGLPNLIVRALLISGDGALWIGTSDGLARFSDGVMTVFGPDQGLEDGFVRALAEDSSGRLWVGTNQAGLFVLEGDRLRRFVPDAEVELRQVRAIVVDGDDSMWVAAEPAGLLRIGTTQKVEVALEGPIWSLFEDREGSLWVGSQAGLVQLRSGRVTTFGRAQGLASDSVRVVFQDRRGVVWIGSDDGGVQLFDGQRFVLPKRLAALAATSVRSLFEDRNGHLWVGTRNGILKLAGERIEQFGSDNGLPDEMVNVVAEDSAGVLWVGTAAGLVVFEEGVFRSPNLDQPLPNSRIRALLPEPDGSLWVGTEGGIVRLGPVSSSYSVAEGLASDVVLSVHRDDGGRLWVGTAAGLSLIDGSKAISFSASQGLPERAVFQILEDDDHNLWLCTSRGIHRFAQEQLLHLAEGRQATVAGTVLGEGDGLASGECNGGTQPAGWRTTDGRLLFPTTKGLAALRAGELRRRPMPPRVVIDSMWVDQEKLDLRELESLRAGSRNVEFRYTAPTFLSAKAVTFRYRLEGLQEEWVYAGRRRRAFFTNLDPGSYRFRVAAASEEGLWDESGEAVAFSIRPHLYERRGFQLLALALLAGVVSSVYMRRMSQARRREAHLAALVEERTEQLQRANQVLEGLAATDALTGITNYRRFQEVLREEWRRAMRRRSPLSLILIDVDHFKSFNDTYGHSAGDSCLRQVARCLDGLVHRQGDVVARYGGEEFAVLLPATPEDSALKMAEKFRQAVRDLEIAHRGSSADEFVTVSVGTATVTPQPGDESSHLFEATDAALYQAKRSGRNRVVVAPRRARDSSAVLQDSGADKDGSS
ncbi:MAG: diguanylate cyclase [Acidobacteriota bacterium]|nr:diguanylate cyclase [Acidobacteriota bacterium]